MPGRGTIYPVATGVATEKNVVVGVVFQSPLSFRAIVTPMVPDVVPPVVDAISDAKVRLPGVVGDVTTAAYFAGQWAERQKSAAIPFLGQRLYEVDKVKEPTIVEGHFRRAVPDDRDCLVDWVRCFYTDIGVKETEAEDIVDSRIPAGADLAMGQCWTCVNGRSYSPCGRCRASATRLYTARKSEKRVCKRVCCESLKTNSRRRMPLYSLHRFR